MEPLRVTPTRRGFLQGAAACALVALPMPALAETRAAEAVLAQWYRLLIELIRNTATYSIIREEWDAVKSSLNSKLAE